MGILLQFFNTFLYALSPKSSQELEIKKYLDTLQQTR